MFNMFKKTDTLDLVVEISYFDSMNCLVLIDTPTIPTTFKKGGDIKKTIHDAVVQFSKLDNKIQSAFKDIRVPAFSRSGWLYDYELSHNGKFDMVKSNRKFWNHTVIDASGAETPWGKEIQQMIKGK